MKNHVALVLMLALLSGKSFSLESEPGNKVESVTIYHSGALVSRVLLSDLSPGINTLLLRNVSSKIILNSIMVNNKEVTILNKTLIRKLSKEETDQLNDRKEALKNMLSLINSKYNEAGFVSKMEELEKMNSFYTEKTLQIKKELRKIEMQLLDARALDSIELKSENAAILKLIVSIEKKLNSPLQIQYVCGGIGWEPSYEISSGGSTEKSLIVKYLAKVMSQTGEDWENITLKLSSSFPLDSPTNLPRPEEKWFLGSHAFKSSNIQSKQVPDTIQSEKPQYQQQIDLLEGVEYTEISVPSFLKLRTLPERYSIKSNSTVFTFPIQTVILPATYFYYGYPSVDPEVYLVAQITGYDTLGFVDGIASINYESNNIGKSVIKFSESPDTLLLPIGKDNSVYMKRLEIADQKYFKSSSSGKKQETTLAFRFEIKNNNSFPIIFQLVDQIPVSQTKSVEIEFEKTSSGKMNKEEGEITWEMELKPGESGKKELIYTLEINSSYVYAKSLHKKRYRTISAPRF